MIIGALLMLIAIVVLRNTLQQVGCCFGFNAQKSANYCAYKK